MPKKNPKKTKPVVKPVVKSVAKPVVKSIVESKNTRIYLLVLLALSYALYVTWGLLSNSTWDDDCVTRYFRTLNAFYDPHEFISLWNRPLFVIIFSIPVAVLGKLAIPLVMSFISAIGAYFLYQSARIYKFQYALLVVPFMLFQPFFLGTGRDAMTEPMAATIIACGIYASLKNRWLIFSLLGAILPLARTELAVLLPIWAFVLFKEKQYKFIPVLGLGLVLWNAAGWIIDGDALYIFHQTLDKADEKNRYGLKDFLTYFNRYLYVVGPVVFYFLVLGLIHKVRRLDIQPLVLIQFVAGFLLYTLLAWKITIGQSAGFLRNLIPLSPLAALIAVDGFENITDLIQIGKNKFLIFLLCIGVAALSIAVFPFKLAEHHFISIPKKFDYLSAGLISGIAIALCLGIVFQKLRQEKFIRGFAMLTGAVTIAYALYTEPPWANMNSEREMMNKVAECYKACGLESAPRTLCSHLWFHWANNYIPFRKGSKFISMSKDSLEAAPPGSVIIWEKHYSNRLGSNIDFSLLTSDSQYCLLGSFYPDDVTYVAYMFIKMASNKSEMNYLNDMISKNPNSSELYIRRSNIDEANGEKDKSLADLQQAAKLAPKNNTVKLSLATYYLSNNNNQEAISIADDIIASNTELVNAYLIKGNALYNTMNYAKAIDSYAEILKRPEDNKKAGIKKDANYNIGMCYVSMNKMDDACKYLYEAKRLNMPGVEEMINKYCNKVTPQ